MDVKCRSTLLYVIGCHGNKDDDDGRSEGELDLLVMWLLPTSC